MRQTPELERMLMRCVIRLCKYGFSVSQAEQRVRLQSREADPLIVSTAQHVLHKSDHILGKALHPDPRLPG